jgi:hypothetical protein
MGDRTANMAWIWGGNFVKIPLEHSAKPKVHEVNQQPIHYAAKYGNPEAHPN